MRRILSLCLVLCLTAFAVPAGAVLSVPSPKAQPTPGENLVTHPGEDGSVWVEGVAGDPVPCTYDSFETAFVRQIKADYDIDVELEEAVYSDGAWVHVMPGDSSWVLVRTAGPELEALITSITAAGTSGNEGDVLALSAVAMAAAAKCGQMGTWSMELLTLEGEPEGYFKQEPWSYWFENGFDLSFRSQGNYMYGNIVYQRTVPVTSGYIVPKEDQKVLPDIKNGPTPEEFVSRVNAYVSYFGFDELTLQEPEKLDGTTWARKADWCQCVVMVLSNEKDGPASGVVISNYSDDTNYAWGASFLSFLAVTGTPFSQALPLSLLCGGRGTWDDLTAMQPFAVVNGVMLQCDVAQDHPLAYIFAAEPEEPAL